jgi:hypothetical protein
MIREKIMNRESEECASKASLFRIVVGVFVVVLFLALACGCKSVGPTLAPNDEGLSTGALSIHGAPGPNVYSYANTAWGVFFDTTADIKIYASADPWPPAWHNIHTVSDPSRFHFKIMIYQEISGEGWSPPYSGPVYIQTWEGGNYLNGDRATLSATHYNHFFLVLHREMDVSDPPGRSWSDCAPRSANYGPEPHEAEMTFACMSVENGETLHKVKIYFLVN